jgi:hypothetical protein
MLRIKDWDTLYENANSRKLKRLNSVLLPNRFDGSKYAELITGENGVQRYAAWCTLLGIGSSGGPGQRGYVRRSDGSPHTPSSLSLVTRIPEAVYVDAIPALVKLGWLEKIAQLDKSSGNAKPEPNGDDDDEARPSEGHPPNEMTR